MAVPAKFPSTTDVQRIEKETEYYNLFNCDFYNRFFKRTWFLLQEYFKNDEEKMKILALTLDLTPALVGAGADFLFGEDVKIEVQTEAGPDKDLQKRVDDIVRRNDLQQRLYDSSKPFQFVGHTQFQVSKDVRDGKPVAVIQELPFNTFFPDFENLPQGASPTRFFKVIYIKQLDAAGIETTKYIYVEEHVAGEIRYYLFENADGKIGKQLPLDTVPGLLPKREGQQTEGLTVIEKTGLSAVTIVQIDGEKTVHDRLGQSVLKPVRPLLDEINTRLTQVSLQMMKTLDPILQVPKSGVPLDENGQVQRKKLEVYLVENGDPDARYITNDNPMVEEAFKYIELLIEKCAKLTKTPQAFLMSDEKGGVESVEALRTRFMLFLKRIRGYRKAYASGIEKLLRLALEIEGAKVPDGVQFKLTFDYGLPQDPEVEGKVWGQAVMDGISSVETAVRRFQNIEGHALEEEMARIKKDIQLMPPVGAAPGNPADPRAAA